MSHARIEEVSDSDPEIDDPSDFLPDNDAAIIRRTDAPSSSSASRPQQQQQQQQQKATFDNSTLFRPPSPSEQISRESIKHFVSIYPCYFSASRTRSQGRRVSKALAIQNPLAYNLLPALRHVCGSYPAIKVAFEPDKTHPKDWSNPGRVRVQLFDKDTHTPLAPDLLPNKERLFVLVAEYMRDHPTTAADAVALKIPGLNIPDNFEENKIAKPRGKGWAIMNEVLPLHSPAVSGGGVKDDFFKEAMEEMKQMQAAQGAGAGAGGPGAGGPGGGMDMGALQQMMQGMGGMGGMGGLANMFGGGGGGGAGGSGSGTASPGGSEAGAKKKGKKGKK